MSGPFGGGYYGGGPYGGGSTAPTPLNDQYTQMGWVDASQAYITVAGTTILASNGSLKITNAIGQRSTCNFTINDLTGAVDYPDGEQTQVFQSLGGKLLFAGPLTDSKRNRVGLGTGYVGVYPVQCQASDWHYLADKRVVAFAYEYQTCGAMARNLVDNVLSQEGVTYQRGINFATAQQSSIEAASFPYPDFNTTLGGGGGIAYDTATSHVGNASLRVTTDGSFGFEAVSINAPIAQYVPNGVYTFSAYMKASSGTPTIRFFCQANDQITGNTSVGHVGSVTLSTTFTRYSFTVQMPSSLSNGGTNWTFLGIRWDTGSPAQAITFWVDGVQFERGPSATNWVLGGTGVNLLSANQASVETDTSGFAIVNSGTTLSRDTTQAWSGISSLKVVNDGTVGLQGVKAALPASSFVADAAYTLSTWIYGTGSVRLFLYDEVNFVAVGPVAIANLGQYWQRIQVTAVMPHTLNGGTYSLRVDDGVTAATTWWMDGLQIERAVATPWELGGLMPSIQEGPVVVNYQAPYVPGSKMMDDLSQFAGFYWQIDQNKVMWFLLPTTIAAPFTYDGTQGIYGTQTVENTSPLYRNSQWLLNIPDVTALQTETRKGDGNSRAFTMSYPFNNVPTVTLNGTAQTVGIKGVDDQAHSKHWYWSKGDPVLAQESNDTVLATTDTLVVSYIGQWVSNVYSQNPSLVAQRATLDGTSGIVEEAHNDPTIVTAAAAFQTANALLSRYGVIGKQITFQTRVGGLAPGMLLNMNMLSPGWQLSSVQALIQQVDITIVGQWFLYTITAIVGPFNQNWVQFYQKLAGVGAIVPGSAGSNQNVSLLAAFTASWGWAATFTATVFACPIVGPSTLCGPSRIIC